MPHGNQKTKQRRNPNGAGSIRQRVIKRNGKEYVYWEARYTTGYDSGTGKQIQKAISGKSKKEVAEKLRQVTREVDTGEYIDPCKMTLGQWLDIWQEDYLISVKPTTASIYEGYIEHHIKPALGAIRLDHLAPHDIQRAYNTLKTSGGRELVHDEKGNVLKKNGESVYKKVPLSGKTVKSIHNVLHSALKQAQRNGYIRYNPTEACVLPRQERKPFVPLDEEESRAFLKEIRGDPYEALFFVTLFTGLRISEAFGLTWDRVDFSKSTIVIDRQFQLVKGTRGQYTFASTKNNKSRSIKAAPWVMDVLRHQKATQAEQQLMAGPMWENNGFVFSTEFGHHLSYRTTIKHYKKAVTAIGRPDARFHDLRHSYAVAAIRSGDDIKTVQSNLGHASAAFTLDFYGYVTDQMKAASADRMNAYIQRVISG